MSIFAVGATGGRSDEFWVVISALVVFYLALYPFYIFFVRYNRKRRIETKIVTSTYKLSLKMTPAEVAYIFSSKISKRHLYATLLDLTNRSVLYMENNQGKIMVKMGPKVENKLKSFEVLLINYVHSADGLISIDSIVQGTTNFKTTNNQNINGSKTYVFWWLLRDSMQKTGLINKNMRVKYIKMLSSFGLLLSFIVSILSVLIWRIGGMLNDGEIDFSIVLDSIGKSFSAWVIAVLPVIIVSFFLLRFRGLMLGRRWLLTEKSKHHLGQIDSFRDYVRLLHGNNKLRFESSELKKETKATSKPYSIAFGYEKV